MDICSKCGTNPRHPKHTSYCRQCLTILARIRRDTIRGGPPFTPMTPEQRRVYKLGYAKRWNKANPEKRREANKRWRQANPEKASAHHKAWYWKQKALTQPCRVVPPCEICGATGAQMHHEDHAKPYDIRWLCPRCHVGVDRGTLVLPPRHVP